MHAPSPPTARRILHLGLGAFHRAHQAVYLQRLIDQGDTGWQLAGGNLRPDMEDTVAALRAQGGVYTLETVTPAGVRHHARIAAIGEVVAHEPSLAGLVALGADPATRIISFTVTEAGYCLDGQHRLDPRHPELASDLADSTRSTVYGALAAILDARMRRGSGPVTLLSCDNLRSNGERFHAAFVDFLRRRGNDALLAWVLAHTSAPNGMVDRITPRPTPDLRRRVLAATGIDDGAAVMAESFMQWVIEDRFAAGRPAWERVGVELVDAVLPFEEAKIRILNAGHSAVAWAGALAGLRFVHEAVARPAIRRMAADWITGSVIPALQASVDPYPLDLAAYRDLVIERFGNAALQDTTLRVAADSSAKFSGFVLPTLRDCIAAGVALDHVAVLPALFFDFLRCWHRGALPFQHSDQSMDLDAVHALFASADPLDAFCRDAALWGPLAGDPRLAPMVRTAQQRVEEVWRSST